jgi:hypothetical protein
MRFKPSSRDNAGRGFSVSTNIGSGTVLRADFLGHMSVPGAQLPVILCPSSYWRAYRHTAQ